MPSIKICSILALLSVLLGSCMHATDESWTTAVPGETSFIIIPSQDATVQSVLQAPYLPFMEDVSTSAIQLVAAIDSNATPSMRVHSILLYPAGNKKMQPIWVTRRSDDFEKKLKEKYALPFAQNQYYFHDVKILNLQLNNRHLFIAGLSDFLLISESSLGIENAIRVYRGMQPAADIADLNLKPGTIIMNTPSLDRWISDLARVGFQPTIKNVFKGTMPAALTVESRGDSTAKQYQLSGSIALKEDAHSPLIKALSYQNGPITLDSYISSDAAAFGIFQVRPAEAMPASLPDTTVTDSYLFDHSETYDAITKTLDPELGLAMYAKSGFLSKGEYVFLRKLKNPDALRRQLDAMSQNAGINKQDSVYYMQSYALGPLLGSPLCNFTNFYIKITDQAAVISKRKGLAERVVSDYDRKAVVSYDYFFKKITAALPKQMSSLVVTGSQFNVFITPLLSGNQYLKALTAPFKHLALSTQINDSGDRISLNLSTFNSADAAQAFRENWIYKTGSAKLTGRPVLANIGGSFNKEIIFATATGKVYALAADGTLVQQYSTGSDKPVGSPVVYDWYGSDQNVVLIAAGNKIYGWDQNGELLSNFPLQLNETITTPLSVVDIDHNKLPDAIVGTANRRLHILNGRGNELAGWPVTTNAGTIHAPYVGYFQGTYSVVSFSANAVHAWDVSGNILADFPLFINAEFRGSPVKMNNTILGNAVDGNLYGIGGTIPFADSLNTYHASSSSMIKAINVSNRGLAGTPFVKNDKILVTSNNGSLFLFNASGHLLLSRNMGQAPASNAASQIVDINSDGNPDIVALADYGRLYAWQISTGNRIVDLPKAGMDHLTIGDIDGDGLQEIIAQTDEGVRSWTVNRKQ